MELKNFLFITFLFITFSSLSYGSDLTYDFGQSWNYTSFTTDSTTKTKILLSHSSGQGNFVTLSSLGYFRYFINPSTTEDLILFKTWAEITDVNIDYGPYYPSFSKYSPTTYGQINSGDVCRGISLNYDNVQKKLYLDSTLQQLQTSSGDAITYQSQPLHQITSPIDSLLDKYYYMKTFTFLLVEKQGTTSIKEFVIPDSTSSYYTYNNITYNNPSGSLTSTQVGNIGFPYNNAFQELHSNNRLPYTLLKPDPQHIDFNLNLNNIINNLQTQCLNNISYCGNYNVTAYVVPIDGKCDFNNDNFLQSGTEFLPASSNTETLSISPPNTSLELQRLGDGGGSYLVNITQSAIGSNALGPVTGTFCGINCREYQIPIGSIVDVNINPNLFSIFESWDNTCSSSGGNPQGTSCSNLNISGLTQLNVKISKDYFNDTDSDGTINADDWCDGTQGDDILHGCDKPYELIGCSKPSIMNYNILSNQFFCSYDYVGLGKYYNTCNDGDEIDICQVTDYPLLNPINKMQFMSYFCLLKDDGLLEDGDFDSDDRIKAQCHLKYTGPEKHTSESDIVPTDNNIISIEDDSDKINKFIYDYNQNQIIFLNFNETKFQSSNLNYFDSNLINTNIIDIKRNWSENNKTIKIYKDGVLNRTEKVNPVVIALKSSQIKEFSSEQEAVSFVQNSVNLMKKFDIEKHINTTDYATTGKSKIKIDLKNFTDSKTYNLTLWQVIPKYNNGVPVPYSSINFINDGGGVRFTKDKDPIIGWYFNESDGNETIEYELPGDGEGGTIIISQEPILYNEGDLIINYRQGSCSSDEAYLFQLDSLEDAVVYSPTDGNHVYKVCVAHITENLEADNTLSNVMDILSYTSGSNASMNTTFYPQLSQISVNKNNIYWDLKIQKTNPTGNYSCIGSINNKDSSLFGDCEYNSNNRIWLHLGEDGIPPTTTLQSYYPAHTTQLTLKAEDNTGGSGVKELNYCWYEEHETGKCQLSTDFTNISSDTAEFIASCPNDWGCIIYIKTFAEDYEGNIETTKTLTAKLLDKGSACQADCTAKPSPNRYLKECRNLNGCEYYTAPWEKSTQTDEDDGKHVAQACDLYTEKAWVQYDSTYEIQCPQGPFRKSMFTEDTIEYGFTNCENVKINKYPLIINGKSIYMNIVSCIN